jgi:hypothetical protein
VILSIFDRKRYVCRTVFKKVLFFIACFQKSVITTVKGYKVISPGKEGTEPMADLELLSIGLINDMYCESRNDSFSYAVLADQAAMDAF